MEVINKKLDDQLMADAAAAASSSSGVWIYGLIDDSQLKCSSSPKKPNSYCSSSTNSSAAAGPDLELTLAAPSMASNLEQNSKKAPPGSLLVGPISVT